MDITTATAPTLGNCGACVRRNEIGQQSSALIVESDRSRWYTHDKIAPIVPILLLATTWFSVLGNEARLVLEIKQGRETFIDFQDDVTSTATVAPRRAAK